MDTDMEDTGMDMATDTEIIEITDMVTRQNNNKNHNKIKEIMKKGVVLFCTAFLFSVFTIFAQEKKDSSKEIEELGKGQKAKYWDNWFITAGTNVNLLWGEQDKEIASLTSRLKFGGGNFSIGKWFTPTLGMRIQAISAALKGFNYIIPMGRYAFYYHPASPLAKSIVPIGFSEPSELHAEYIIPDDYFTIQDTKEIVENEGNWHNFKLVNSPKGRAFTQEMSYYSVTVDAMTNFTYLFHGSYKEGMLLDVIPFVGAGFLHAKEGLSNPAYTYGVVKAGLQASINLGNLAIFAEIQGNITSHDFDGYVGDELFDMVFHGMAGLQYTFNKRFATVQTGGASLSLDEINYLNEKINNNRTMIEKHQNILDRHQDLLDRLNQCCEEEEGVRTEKEIITKTEVITTKYLPEYIRFTLNSAQIQLTEESKLKDAVEFMKANPSSKLLLVGYADKKTGASSYNYDLSRKRVEGVSQELIRRGADPKRLILEWRGDTEQPYAPNDWNRVVIMVER
ncbi:MAG: OmpA family protein [Dysgonamonadaceae bacterium]|jgi:outer membrane protein OmpA-like peptidoglycan-associated protein|nr:OmpA family protein [Dysgonamonadaceae bacterium]